MSCPVCAESDMTSQIDHAGGRPWLCGRCQSLFTGAPGEWERQAFRRKEYIDRRENTRAIWAARVKP